MVVFFVLFFSGIDGFAKAEVSGITLMNKMLYESSANIKGHSPLHYKL